MFTNLLNGDSLVNIAVSAYSGEPSEFHIKNALKSIDIVMKCFRNLERWWLIGGYRGLMRHVVNHLLSIGERVALILPIEYESMEYPKDLLLIRTGMSFANRNVVMIRTGDLLLSLGGGAGSTMEAVTTLELGKEVFLLCNTGLPTDALARAYPDGILDERKGGKLHCLLPPYNNMRQAICRFKEKLSV